MKARRTTTLALFALATTACARTHDGMSIQLRDATAAGFGTSGHTAREGTRAGKTAAVGAAGSFENQATRDGGVAKPIASNVKTGAEGAAGTPDSPDATAGEATEVWIGQLWSVAPSLCDPSAPWGSNPRSVQPMGYVNRVVLILEDVGGAQLQGRVQLGEGAVPTSPGNEPYDTNGKTSYWICSIQLPTMGMEYRLIDPVLTSDRLMFAISASAVWNTFCETQGAPCPGAPDGGCPTGPDSFSTVCTCKNSTCEAAEYSLVAFDLAVTADTIEGELPSLGGGWGTPAQLRLRRVQ
jgi:hypothetical protein